MSVRFAAFIGPGCPFDRLVEFVRKNIGLQLTEEHDEPGPYFQTNVLGLYFEVIGDSDLVDDMGIEFSKYPFQINITRSGTSPHRELLEELAKILCHLIASHISRMYRCDCIVVRDVQEVIGRFPAPPPVAFVSKLRLFKMTLGPQDGAHRTVTEALIY